MGYGKIVVSLSGSFFEHAEIIKRYAEIVRALKNRAKILCLVTGGGKTARKYIALAKALGLSREIQDCAGILATRIHAYLFASLFGLRKIPFTCQTAVKYAIKKGCVVCGGIKPGQSTDKVAADLAAKINADVLINLTKVDGVYDKDPAAKGARMFRELTYREFARILRGLEQAPGKYALFDVKALEVIERCRIPLVIANGTKPENLLKIASGKRVGTLIRA